MPDDIEDLEAPAAWDWDAAVNRPANPLQCVSVSVSYSASEFADVAACAERDGKSVADFMRTAVLEAGREQMSRP